MSKNCAGCDCRLSNKELEVHANYCFRCRYAKKKQSWAENLEKRFRHMYNCKRANCKYRGIEFNIEFEDIDFVDRCPMLGVELDYTVNALKHENGVQFDRINPKLGYVKGNVRVLSSGANRLKSDLNLERCEKVFKFLKETEEVLR